MRNYDIVQLKSAENIPEELLDDIKVIYDFFLEIWGFFQLIVEWIFNDMKEITTTQYMKPILLEFLSKFLNLLFEFLCFLSFNILKR